MYNPLNNGIDYTNCKISSINTMLLPYWFSFTQERNLSPFADKGKEDHEDGPPLLDQDDAATRALLDRIDVDEMPVPFSNIASVISLQVWNQ